VGECGQDSSDSGQGPIVSCWQHNNEPLGSIKMGGGISWKAELLLASQSGLCST
jgi:hypothetical protein